jgi:hypothetical protein
MQLTTTRHNTGYWRTVRIAKTRYIQYIYNRWQQNPFKTNGRGRSFKNNSRKGERIPKHTFNPVFTLRLQFNDLWNMVDNCAIQHGALHTRAIAVHVRSQPTANSTFAPQTMWTWGTPFAGGERMWLNIEERRGKVQRRLIVDIGSWPGQTMSNWKCRRHSDKCGTRGIT